MSVRVLFWGTPDFGIPSLDAMREAGHEVVGVVTNPDRPAGRGRSPRASPVKRWAEAAERPVLQPEKPVGDEFLGAVAGLAADINVVAAYGRILREEVLELPPHGSVNVHASLLPELRGAAPINWAIIRGHERTGVTIMRMVRELDAGAILRQVERPIGPDTTAGELFESLAALGAEALVETLADLAAGTAVEREQDHERATYAPKLDREAARLDWGAPAIELDRRIRGCDPWPAAWTTLDDEPVQLFSPRPEPPDPGRPDEPPGRITIAASGDVVVATGSGPLRIREVRPAGRRRMAAADWARGRRGLEGARFA